mmetsp:Transcript_21283/g.29522  ORF Transcript_21283/g.29522 Transcript_21283/m.29522 type:complete len:214 (+) Transcript_21283:769-1410(+)
MLRHIRGQHHGDNNFTKEFLVHFGHIEGEVMLRHKTQAYMQGVVFQNMLVVVLAGDGVVGLNQEVVVHAQVPVVVDHRSQDGSKHLHRADQIREHTADAKHGAHALRDVGGVGSVVVGVLLVVPLFYFSQECHQLLLLEIQHIQQVQPPEQEHSVGGQRGLGREAEHVEVQVLPQLQLLQLRVLQQGAQLFLLLQNNLLPRLCGSLFALERHG